MEGWSKKKGEETDMAQFLEKNRRYRKVGDCLVFYLAEELDHHAAERFREISDSLIEKEQIKNIVFDFTGVKFMDSSGIGMLMGRYKKVMFSGGRAAVAGVGEVVDRIFLLSGLYKILEKYETTEEALENMQK